MKSRLRRCSRWVLGRFGFSGFGDSGLGSRTVTTSGVALTPVPSSTPPPPPAAEPQALTGLLLGLLGAGARSSSSGHQRSPNEEEPDKLHFAAGTGTVAVKPGAIPGRQDSLRVMATVFLAALQVAQAAQHASRAAGPQASCHSLQPSTQEEQSSSQPQLALPSAPTQDLTTVSPQVQGICQAVALPTNQLFHASGLLSNGGAV